jgi:hypothetical protein
MPLQSIALLVNPENPVEADMRVSTHCLLATTASVLRV